MARTRLALAALALVTVACSPAPAPKDADKPADAGPGADAGDAGGATDAGDEPKVVTVEVMPDPELICVEGCLFVKVGETRHLVAVAKDASGTVIAGVTFTWRSQNDALATVDDEGVVTARGVGEAQIIATGGGVEGNTTLFIDARRVAAVVVTPDRAALAKGETVDLVADAQDDFGLSIGGVTWLWASSDDRIATVDAAGRVTGVATGTAVIQVSTTQGGGASVVVAVSAPEPRARGYGYAKVSVGDTHACGLDATGRAACWGWNFFGQLGNAQRGGDQERFPTPGWTDTATRFKRLMLGQYHSCALTVDGEAWCWGSGANGELGVTDAVRSIGGTTVPTAVVGGHPFVDLAAGGSHTCGLDDAGAAWCWGAGIDGATGTGLATESWVPTAVVGGHTFTDIVTGLSSTCALDLDGKAWCWGSDARGQLGNGEPSGDGVVSREPVKVAGDRAFVSLHLAESHACALTAAGEAWCWGNDEYGQLGDGSIGNKAEPVKVDTTLSFGAITTGAHHTCALTTAGTAWCWGNATNAQLGDGTLTSSPVPVAVAGGLVFEALESGANATCGVTTDGEAVCWGSAYFGELGHGVGGEGGLSPVPVGVLAPAP